MYKQNIKATKLYNITVSRGSILHCFTRLHSQLVEPAAICHNIGIHPCSNLNIEAFNYYYSHAKFEILATVTMRMTVFWDVTPSICVLCCKYLCFCYFVWLLQYNVRHIASRKPYANHKLACGLEYYCPILQVLQFQRMVMWCKFPSGQMSLWSYDVLYAELGHTEWTDVIYTMQESNLDTCGARKRDKGVRARQGGKRRKQTYLMCIASFRNIVATNLLVQCSAELN
jgi:hypothetical protein